MTQDTRCGEGYAQNSSLCSVCEGTYRLGRVRCERCTSYLAYYLTVACVAVFFYFPLLRELLAKQAQPGQC